MGCIDLEVCMYGNFFSTNERKETKYNCEILVQGLILLEDFYQSSFEWKRGAVCQGRTKSEFECQKS